MTRNGNHMPKPDEFWIALGILVAAWVETTTPKQRRQFIAALERHAAEHENSVRVIVFGSRRRWNGGMSSAIRGGVSWVKGLIIELKRAVDG